MKFGLYWNIFKDEPYILKVMNPSSDIDVVKNKNYYAKIKAEIDCLKNGEKTFGLTDSEITNRIELLENIMGNKIFPKKPTLEDEKNNMFASLEKHIFKKQWNKLLSFHKIIKLKEYIKEKHGEGPLQDEIVMKLSQHINDGKVNTKKFVTYDPNAEKILSLTCLFDVDLESGTYKIKF